MVAKTQSAITGDDTRFFLNGAKFILKPRGLTLVATDGHRLALVEGNHDTGAQYVLDVLDAVDGDLVACHSRTTEPGGHETGRFRRVSVHVRDHAMRI